MYQNWNNNSSGVGEQWYFWFVLLPLTDQVCFATFVIYLYLFISTARNYVCLGVCTRMHVFVHRYMHCCKYDVSMHTLIKLLVKIKQYSKTLFTAKYSKTSGVFIVGSGSRCDYKQFCLNAVNYVMIHLSSESQ